MADQFSQHDCDRRHDKQDKILEDIQDRQIQSLKDLENRMDKTVNDILDRQEHNCKLVMDSQNSAIKEAKDENHSTRNLLWGLMGSSLFIVLCALGALALAYVNVIGRVHQ